MRNRDEVVLRFRDSAAAAQRCADELTSRIAELAEQQDQVVIALCGGSSPNALYEKLASSIPTLHETARSKLRFIPLDERCVGDEDPQFNLPAIEEKLFDPLTRVGAIVSWQVCWYHFSGSLEKSLGDFQAAFERFGGSIDVVIAGSGEDGHIASLFPASSQIEDHETRSFVQVMDSPKAPPERVTASRLLISDAAITVGIFLKGKEEAFANFNQTAATLERECPAKLLRVCTNPQKKLEPILYVLTNIY